MLNFPPPLARSPAHLPLSCSLCSLQENANHFRAPAMSHAAATAASDEQTETPLVQTCVGTSQVTSSPCIVAVNERIMRGTLPLWIRRKFAFYKEQGKLVDGWFNRPNRISSCSSVVCVHYNVVEKSWHNFIKCHKTQQIICYLLLSRPFVLSSDKLNAGIIHFQRICLT